MKSWQVEPRRRAAGRRGYIDLYITLNPGPGLRLIAAHRANKHWHFTHPKRRADGGGGSGGGVPCGEIYFAKGTLTKWTNGSGHYTPEPHNPADKTMQIASVAFWAEAIS
jgi:hypothetical protein